MNLQKLMTAKKISQGKLSKESGVSQAQISRILSGQHPTLPTIQKLAKGLGVTISELLNDNQATDTEPNDAA